MQTEERGGDVLETRSRNLLLRKLLHRALLVHFLVGLDLLTRLPLLVRLGFQEGSFHPKTGARDDRAFRRVWRGM